MRHHVVQTPNSVNMETGRLRVFIFLCMVLSVLEPAIALATTKRYDDDYWRDIEDDNPKLVDEEDYSDRYKDQDINKKDHSGVALVIALPLVGAVLLSGGLCYLLMRFVKKMKECCDKVKKGQVNDCFGCKEKDANETSNREDINDPDMVERQIAPDVIDIRPEHRTELSRSLHPLSAMLRSIHREDSRIEETTGSIELYEGTNLDEFSEQRPRTSLGEGTQGTYRTLPSVYLSVPRHNESRPPDDATYDATDPPPYTDLFHISHRSKKDERNGDLLPSYFEATA